MPTGRVCGALGNVVVAPEARVAAKIIAEHVSVAGEVTGAIYARGHLEILSTGRVAADVAVVNFYKDESGILSGRLSMGQEAVVKLKEAGGYDGAARAQEEVAEPLKGDES